jgi:hypothetical protein
VVNVFSFWDWTKRTAAGRECNDNPPTWIASMIIELEEGLKVGFLYIIIEDYYFLERKK